MKIIPAIDIIEGKTVRLEKGDYDKKISYDLTPVDAAFELEKQGAGFLHVIDLDGAREGEPVNIETIKKIVEKVNIPIEVGGGYRTFDDIDRALNIGVERVILGSSAVKDLSFAEKAIKKYGEKVIISIDVLDGKIKVHGWEADSEHELTMVLSKLKEFGATRINFTDVSKDGTLEGPDIGLLKEILDSTDLKMIYAGGIKSIEHIKALKNIESMGIEGVITGRAIYDGTIDIREAISVS